jgi:hypothetical protein
VGVVTVARIDWQPVIAGLAGWVEQQDGNVTLRQAFYAAVSSQVIPNTQAAYKRLSSLTAEARRDGSFPAFVDGTRDVLMASWWQTPEQFAAACVEAYRIDRWAGQDTLLVLGVEKRGMGAQVHRWFGSFGFPIVPLGGYCSQTLADDVAARIAADGRDAVLLYVGDHDASGHDIERDFTERVGLFAHTRRVALTPEQVDEYALPANPAKESDSRTAAFARLYGPVQVEVDALPPEVLRVLLLDAVTEYVDVSRFDAAVHREQVERAVLATRLGVAS